MGCNPESILSILKPLSAVRISILKDPVTSAVKGLRTPKRIIETLVPAEVVPVPNPFSIVMRGLSSVQVVVAERVV